MRSTPVFPMYATVEPYLLKSIEKFNIPYGNVNILNKLEENNIFQLDAFFPIDFSCVLS